MFICVILCFVVCYAGSPYSVAAILKRSRQVRVDTERIQVHHEYTIHIPSLHESPYKDTRIGFSRVSSEHDSTTSKEPSRF